VGPLGQAFGTEAPEEGTVRRHRRRNSVLIQKIPSLGAVGRAGVQSLSQAKKSLNKPLTYLNQRFTEYHEPGSKDRKVWPANAATKMRDL
jgi:hypothetical protein